MDKEQRKQAVREWKERHPAMGVFSITCVPTGATFAGTSKDTEREYNRHTFQLEGNMHPNKQLQALWNEYGEDAFEYNVIEELKYDDPQADLKRELVALLDDCLARKPELKHI